MAMHPNPEEIERLRAMGQLTGPTAARLEGRLPAAPGLPATQAGFQFTPERLDELKTAGLDIDEEMRGRLLELPQPPLAPAAVGTAPSPLGLPVAEQAALPAATSAGALGFQASPAPLQASPAAPLGFGPTDVVQGLDALPPANTPAETSTTQQMGTAEPGGFAKAAGVIGTQVGQLLKPRPVAPIQVPRLPPQRPRPAITPGVAVPSVQSDRNLKTDISPAGDDEIGAALLALTR